MITIRGNTGLKLQGEQRRCLKRTGAKRQGVPDSRYCAQAWLRSMETVFTRGAMKGPRSGAWEGRIFTCTDFPVGGKRKSPRGVLWYVSAVYLPPNRPSGS